MRTQISSRQFKATETLKQYAEEKLKKLSQFYPDIIEIKVIFEHLKDTSVNTADVVISIPGGTLTSTATADKHELAIDECVENLKRQLIKVKEKRNNRRVSPPTIVEVEPELEMEDE
ncbi:MAG TPA: ribosome-associated translation inhibitor RaiA [Rhodothermales bacterium]|nr:ribosome-associated translation inhibitor RaiA [Bacteroidota bacterium]HRK73487.1 ribosome-associated translation inhibitor RaiA [Rhodothermales bacterium]HRR10227.1 ribosome-associated translation inhibitor RaiA [Rhodothermales bacterium]